MAEKKKTKTIAIGFDGVLADDSKGYQGKDVFGTPIPGADDATKVLKENGWRIIIYTTRPSTDALKNWLKENNITYDYINEDPDQPEESKGCKLAADVYLDDRALGFSGEWKWEMGCIANFETRQCGQKKEIERMRESYKSILKMAEDAS